MPIETTTPHNSFEFNFYKEESDSYYFVKFCIDIVKYIVYV